MSLSDIVSRLGLATFPVIAMVIFLAIFAVVIARVLSRRLTRTYDHLAALPLESEEAPVRDPDSNTRSRA